MLAKVAVSLTILERFNVLSLCYLFLRPVFSEITSKLQQIFNACCHWQWLSRSLLLWRRCDMLCTSVFFVDDVMFADNWPGKGDAIGRLLKMTHRGRSLMSTIALFH